MLDTSFDLHYLRKQILANKMARKTTEVRQDEIKQAVLEIIFTEGLKSLSTKNIAKHIGMSEGAIFRHFATKQDILLSILEDVQRELINQLREVAVSSLSPDVRLEKFLCVTIRYLAEKRGITLLLFSEALHSDDSALKSSLQQIFNIQRNLVSKIILDGVAIGMWDDQANIDRVPLIYLGIPVTLNIELALNGGLYYQTDFCKQMLELLLKMLRK
ncbi:TetR/AcrR family transcriptional regulator [Microbacter margulisiae]|nr:TetR/AcrR family transcriptional regulator [Microbacter margulisiae]